jgi:hypothetical protein
VVDSDRRGGTAVPRPPHREREREPGSLHFSVDNDCYEGLAFIRILMTTLSLIDETIGYLNSGMLTRSWIFAEPRQQPDAEARRPLLHRLDLRG